MLGDNLPGNLALKIMKKSNRISRRTGRDAAVIASAARASALRSLPPSNFQNSTLPRSQVRNKRALGDFPLDRRVFYPSLDIRPAMRLSGRPARVVSPPVKKPASANPGKPQTHSWSGLLFDRPKEVDVCVRRGVRKEVLFAMRVAGLTGLRPPKLNPFSRVSC